MSADIEKVVAIAQALSDPHRLRILKCLDGSALCLGHFAQILGLTQSTISKHLHVLLEAGLLTSWQEGRWRYYRWAGEEAGKCVQDILRWVSQSLADVPVVVDDAARRAIALEKVAAPSPSVAKPRVLFLCTGNSCRSQMAEALLRKHAGDQFEIYSAGLSPKPIAAETFIVMREIGVDIDGQRPKSVMEFLGREHFGYLITVCANAEAQCPIFPGASFRLYWPFEDPAEAKGTLEERLTKFREVRDQIEQRILAWLRGQESRAITHIHRKEGT